MFTALLKGHTLADPVFWKRIQIAINATIPILPIVVLLYPPAREVLTPETMVGVSTSIGIIITYLSVATTDKIGI